jgi:hypothetical protein
LAEVQQDQKKSEVFGDQLEMRNGGQLQVCANKNPRKLITYGGFCVTGDQGFENCLLIENANDSWYV